MPSGYGFLLVYLLIAAAFPVGSLIASSLVRPSHPSRVKLDAYECGVEAAGTSRGQYNIRFYLMAILFVLFDVETIFLFPWAVRANQLGWFGLAEAGVFLAVLITGYAWAFKKGILDWAE